MINNQALAKVNHNYCGTLRQSLISVENDMLIMKEPIGGTSSYTCLQLVPQELSNILFIAFHTNAMGGHLNAYWTLHHLWLLFYWPGMYAFVKQMCQACPGCALAIPLVASPLSSSTTSQSRHHSWYCILTHMPLATMLDSKGLNATS
jgi:hypothetical protein